MVSELRCKRYIVLASDYDGTLAQDGAVDDDTIAAVKRLISSGRKLVLVTGRELPDLQRVFPGLDLCERVVAENGALLYNPSNREKRGLADAPPAWFIDDLRRRGVSELGVGEVIVGTSRTYERPSIEAVRDSGLALHMIFNKESIMILPSNVDKMTGLDAALDDMNLSRHDVVGVGDAENDHVFLDGCRCSVAVANAITALKERASLVTHGARGAGVTELINMLIASDLSELDGSLTRHRDGIVAGA